MNIFLLLAAALTTILALAHSILGEIKVLRYMKVEGLPILRGIPMMWEVNDAAARTIRFVWHVTSLLGLGLAGILAYFAYLPVDTFVVATIGSSMLLSGLVALAVSRGGHLGWVLFSAVGVLCFLGIA